MMGILPGERSWQGLGSWVLVSSIELVKGHGFRPTVACCVSGGCLLWLYRSRRATPVSDIWAICVVRACFIGAKFQAEECMEADLNPRT